MLCWTAVLKQLPPVLALRGVGGVALCFDYCLWDCKLLRQAHHSQLNSTSNSHQGFPFYPILLGKGIEA